MYVGCLCVMCRVIDHAQLLGCEKLDRGLGVGPLVDERALLPNLALLPRQGLDVAHPDAAHPELRGERERVEREAGHQRRVDQAGRAEQHLVAAENALAHQQVLVVPVVELVGGGEVQVHELVGVHVRGAEPGVAFAEQGVRVGVVQEQADESSVHAADGVRA